MNSLISMIQRGWPANELQESLSFSPLLPLGLRLQIQFPRAGDMTQRLRALAALPEVLGSSPSSQLSNSSSRKSGTLTHIRRQNTHEHKVKIRCIRKVHLQSNARNLTLGSDIASQSIPVNLPKNSPFHTNIQKRCLEARSAHADVKGGLPLPNPSGSVAVVSRFAPDSQILYSETVLSATPEKSTFSH